MLYKIIIACEIGFWALLLAGFTVRYTLKLHWLSNILLVCVPLIDLALLILSVADLRSGSLPTTAHGFAAIYIGVSVAWGKRIVAWADARFAHRFAGGPVPRKSPKTGLAHARHERAEWFRHLLAWAIGSGLMVCAILFIGQERSQPFMYLLKIWSIVLVIDFIISFSYTLWPRQEKS